MTFRRRFLVVAAVAGLVCPASAAEDRTLIGTWIFADARPAPWSQESHHARGLEQASELLNREITFTAKAVLVQHHTLACTGVAYEKTAFPPDIVFQSGLPGPDHARQARELGLRDDLALGIDVACSSGLYSYHFVDRQTALLGFNDMIYTLKRK